MNWKKFRNFTLDAIDTVPVDYDPYAHIHIEQVYDVELYDLLLQNWPDSGWVSNTAHMNQYRMQHTIVGCGDFWQSLYDQVLSHPETVEIVYSKFKLTASCDWVNPTLWEDSAGYKVGPHVDQYRIDIAWQTYIQVDDNTIGTELYRDQQGTLAKKLSSINNSGWIMVNDSESWHGFSGYNTPSLRRSLMTRFMKN